MTQLADRPNIHRSAEDLAFEQRLAPLYRELHLYCYRFVGSVHDAEEVVQETFLRAWRARQTFQGRASVRTWVYRIATNACLEFARRHARRILPPDLPSSSPTSGGPGSPIGDEVSWLEPYPETWIDELASDGDPAQSVERFETVRLAFVAALQFLPPRQRAVLLLRDVLDLSSQETAQLLGTTPAGVNSALQRAHATLQERLPADWPEEANASPADPEVCRIVDRYLSAWRAQDLDGLAALLAEDARMSMPPDPVWFDGRPAILEFLGAQVFAARLDRPLELVPVAVNRQPAFAVYEPDPRTGLRQALGIKVLRLRQGRIVEITGFMDPRLVALMG